MCNISQLESLLKEFMENNSSAIITGIFTLLGIIFGWGLNAISKRGKLKLIDVRSEIVQSSNSALRFKIDLWIYNSADNILSANDLKVEILSHGRKYFNDLIDINNETIYHYNFNPKCITPISTEFQLNQNILKGDIHKVTLT
jgi:hypothetical protein